MLYDAHNMLIIRRQTLLLTTLDMNIAMLNCYECMNLI